MKTRGRRRILPGKYCIIDPKAQIGQGVRIGDFTKIAARAVIEDDVTIGDYCKIGFDDPVDETMITAQNEYYTRFLVAQNKCIIGRGSVVCDGASIFSKVIIGRRCTIGNHAFIRAHNRIGDRVLIGLDVTVSSFCEIGEGSVVLNYSALGSTSKVGKWVFLSPSVMLAENKYMLMKDYRKRRGPIIEDYVRIGCLTTVVSCRVGKFCVIGANSVVAKDLPEGMLYTNTSQRKLTRQERQAYLNSSN